MSFRYTVPLGAYVELLDTTAVVETPERVRFRHRIAGPGRRGMAWLLDAVVSAALLLAAGALLSLLQPVAPLYNAGLGLFLLAFFFVQWGYGVLFEWVLSGRTPGKLALGLRVVRDDGGPATLPDFALRNLLRTADWLPFGFAVGASCMLVDHRLRRIGDLAAGTIVVVEAPARTLGRLDLDPPITEEERLTLPPRVTLSRDETRAIEAFLARRSSLSEERAEELAAYLGPALSERAGVIAPTWSRVLALAYMRAHGRDR